MSILGKHSRDVGDDNHNTSNHDEIVNNVNGLSPPPNKKLKSKECKEVEELKSDSSFQQIVILNVGGTKYTTIIQTLTGYNSMLKPRFSSKYAMKPSDDGSYFIDRDGKLFQYILEYFRNGQLLLPVTWNKQDIWRFYNEIKYYMIDSLFQPVLLKLFDSKMIQHDVLKMKILKNLTHFCKDKSVNTTLNNLKDWDLVYEYDASKGKKITTYDIEWGKIAERMERCLVLFEEEAEFRVFGMLLTHGFVGCLKPKDSFAFECGIYSSRVPSYYTDKDIKVSFEEIRYVAEDDELSGVDFLPDDTFPFIIRPNSSIDHGSGSIGTVAPLMSSVDWNGEVDIHKMEIWFVPMY